MTKSTKMVMFYILNFKKLNILQEKRIWNNKNKSSLESRFYTFVLYKWIEFYLATVMDEFNKEIILIFNRTTSWKKFDTRNIKYGCENKKNYHLICSFRPMKWI